MENKSKNDALKPSTSTLFIKDADRIDCASFEPNQGITGKSWHVDVFVTGELDHNGFVYDFSLLKKTVKNILKKSIDHALLIPIESKQVVFTNRDGEEHWSLQAKARLTNTDMEWQYTCPKGAVYPVRCTNITREIVEQECRRLIRHRLPSHISDVKVILRKEHGAKDESFFRYTHGITDHDGLCQRLFHGHRSKIEVYVGGEKRQDLERYVAHDLFGSIVHIASLSQIQAEDKPDLGIDRTAEGYTSLAYSGNLGGYQAKIPTNRIFFVPHQTSIERITAQIAEHLIDKFNLRAGVRVLCYEGIDKGSLIEL